ncbi:MAG: o-succinylbenzoate--CoA ligase [Chlamydiales bacterium]
MSVKGGAIRCPIHDTAERFPTACALRSDTLHLTYKELDAGISSFSSQLQELGVKRNSRVAFIATSSWQTVLLFFALFRLGAVAVPLSARLPESGIIHLCNALAPDLFLEAGSLTLGKSPCTPAEIDEDKVSLLMSTSGSSGSSKFVALTFKNLYLSAVGSMEKLPLVEEDRWLLSLPLFHIGGIAILMRAFFAGLTVQLSTLPLMEAITHHKIDFLSLVPTQLYRILEQPDILPLKGMLMGGAPFSTTLLKTAIDKGYPLFTSYGMTEMSSQITLDLTPHKNSSGFVLPYRELKIEGEAICVRGPTLFQGYWDKEKGLTLPLDADGWFHTYDRGRYGDAGELIVMGRADSLFISGGENIYPEEIESALMALPGVLEAVVVPIDDKEFGQRPAAFIQTRTPFSEEKIRQKLRKALPGFMIPKRIYPLPQEEVLKRSRLMLRELVEDEA